MSDILTKIEAYKREEIAAAKTLRPWHDVVAMAHDAPPVRGFLASLEARRAVGAYALIAEVKKASPSKGLIRADFDPPSLAKAYAEGGATCLSVLTDEPSFQGRPEYLAQAREASGLPALRKDFTVAAHDVCDARLMGADAVLLIAAALDDAELADFHQLARQLGLDTLIEIHDEAELERALAVDARLVGVNQRDLVTFEVDTDRAVRMAPKMPDGVVRVAESGVRGPDDARRLADAGYHAVLVGESLVTHGDPTAGVEALRRA